MTVILQSSTPEQQGYRPPALVVPAPDAPVPTFQVFGSEGIRKRNKQQNIDQDNNNYIL